MILPPDAVIIKPKPMARAGRARVRVQVIDLDAARHYLAGISGCAAEGAASRDPRVVIMALEILLLAPSEIRRLGRLRQAA